MNSQLGVLLTGFVEKKSPSRFGTLKRKFLVLTHIGLHWFKRQPGEDLFGEERGCIKLGDISIVKRTDEDSAKDEFQRMFEVNCVDGTQRIFLTETESQCDQWVLAIEQAMSNKFKSSHFQSPTSTSKEEVYVNMTDPSLGDDESTELQQTDDFEPGVHLVTVSSSFTGREIVVAREKVWGDTIIISGEGLGEKDAILLTLDGGGIARLGKSVRSEATGPLSLKVYGGGLITEVEVSLTATSNFAQLCKAPHILAPLAASVACILISIYSILLMLLYQHPVRVMLTVTLPALWLASAMLPDAISRATARIKNWKLELIKSVSLPPYTQSKSLRESDKEIPHRYLVACGGSVADAYLSWSNTCSWRQSWEVDSLLSTKPVCSSGGGWPQNSPWKCVGNALTTLRSRGLLCFIAGVDPWGRPCFYLRPSTLDLTVNISHISLSIKEALQRLVVMMLEFEISRQDEDERNEGKALVILDLRDISLKHCVGEVFEFWRSTVRLCQEHYPERCDACVVINSPSIFSFLFKLARAFVNPTTLKKVIVVGSDSKPGSWFRDHLIPEGSESASRLSKLDESCWWIQLLSGYCQHESSDSSHYSDVAPSPGFDGSDPTGVFSEEKAFNKFIEQRCRK